MLEKLKIKFIVDNCIIQFNEKMLEFFIPENIYCVKCTARNSGSEIYRAYKYKSNDKQCKKCKSNFDFITLPSKINKIISSPNNDILFSETKDEMFIIDLIIYIASFVSSVQTYINFKNTCKSLNISLCDHSMKKNFTRKKEYFYSIIRTDYFLYKNTKYRFCHTTIYGFNTTLRQYLIKKSSLMLLVEDKGLVEIKISNIMCSLTEEICNMISVKIKPQKCFAVWLKIPDTYHDPIGYYGLYEYYYTSFIAHFDRFKNDGGLQCTIQTIQKNEGGNFLSYDIDKLTIEEIQ